MALPACGGPSNDAGDRYETILEAPPYTPIMRLGPETYNPTLEDRRQRFAEALEQRHLPILRRLKKGEIGNFGGIEWRWADSPENEGIGTVRGVAYFLREPTASLARYTADPLYSAQTAGFSRDAQDSVVRDWAESIGTEIASPGFGNMSVPWLTLSMSRAEFEMLQQERGWNLPANLALQFDPRADPDLPSVSADARASIRYFAQQERPSGPAPDIATFDAVVLRDGCFFVDGPGEDDPLALFPFNVGIYRDDEGYLAFRPRVSADQRRLSRVGTRMQLGHRREVAGPPAGLIEACGQHRVVAVSAVDQAAGYGNDWFAVREYRDREGIGSAEAMRRANDCLLAQDQTMANNRLRGTRDHPTQCAKTLGIWGNPVNPPPPSPLPPSALISFATEPVYPAAPPKKLEPTRNGVCRFEERDPAERPSELIDTNRASNMIFWADEGAALWDHPNGFVDEGMVVPGFRIVAEREGLPDLWIFPNRDGPIHLYSGPEIFECRQPADW
ncbi:hypothetical protein GRI44_13230 [Altererythrobacter confluentis]|uniref:Uncharacterized protein n=1 Tax=Allopontixanthobacter confluentis TaxID=1849021 RepID=A0A6L7GI71_9SPHN|nr:hypothetical protein [Allopontixanthobacter confluentis]MXP15712.1 hypothetical protein [Allopontixanthobacter confluentis]